MGALSYILIVCFCSLTSRKLHRSWTEMRIGQRLLCGENVDIEKQKNYNSQLFVKKKRKFQTHFFFLLWNTKG